MGLSTIELLRAIPFLGSVAALLAFALFARAYLLSHLATVVAVIAYALMSQGYEWMIAGGGLTRGLGAAFALLAERELWLQFQRPQRRHVLLAGIFCALTVLTHPESASLLAISALLLLAGFGRDVVGLRSTLVIGAATVALTAPWWLTVVTRYGLQPLIAG